MGIAKMLWRFAIDRSVPKAVLALGIMLCAIVFMTETSMAQDDSYSWNRMHIVIVGDHAVNDAVLDRQDIYQSAEMIAGPEYGGGLGVALSWNCDFDLVYSRRHGVANQYNPYSADYLRVELDFQKVAGTVRKKYSLADGMLALWLGVGFDVNLLSMHSEEVITVIPGQQYVAVRSSSTTTAMGAHVGTGLNIYPVQQSAIAITVEGRYTQYFATGPFDASLSGWSCLLGLRWDFWQIGR